MNVTIMHLQDTYTKDFSILDNIKEKIKIKLVKAKEENETETKISKDLNELKESISLVSNLIKNKDIIFKEIKSYIINYLKRLCNAMISYKVNGYMIDAKFISFYKILKKKELYHLNGKNNYFYFSYLAKELVEIIYYFQNLILFAHFTRMSIICTSNKEKFNDTLFSESVISLDYNTIKSLQYSVSENISGWGLKTRITKESNKGLDIFSNVKYVETNKVEM